MGSFQAAPNNWGWESSADVVFVQDWQPHCSGFSQGMLCMLQEKQKNHKYIDKHINNPFFLRVKFKEIWSKCLEISFFFSFVKSWRIKNIPKCLLMPFSQVSSPLHFPRDYFPSVKVKEVKELQGILLAAVWLALDSRCCRKMLDLLISLCSYLTSKKRLHSLKPQMKFLCHCKSCWRCSESLESLSAWDLFMFFWFLQWEYHKNSTYRSLSCVISSSIQTQGLIIATE